MVLLGRVMVTRTWMVTVVGGGLAIRIFRKMPV